MTAASTALLAVGYPVSMVVVARFVPVVRERRWLWLVAHHAGVLAVIGGWATRGRVSAAVVNSAWLVASSVWYGVGGTRRLDA